jgi:hypothetical protein
MSPSEESAKLAALLAELRAQTERVIQAGEVTEVASDDVTNLMSGAIKLYAARVEEAETDVRVIDETVSTTEAMVVACALLRAHRLNPFDLALWFSRAAPNVR